MSERVAIAGGELGRAPAEKLAAAAFTAVGVDWSKQGLKELSDGIRREAADSTDQAAARSAAEVGPPEVLVNTIGTCHLGEALTATPEGLRLMIDVNVGLALWLTRVQQLIAEPADAHDSPHYPDDIWANEVLLDPDTLERSCVHLQNGDLSCLRPGTRTARCR